MKTKISILLAAFAITAFSLVSSPTLSTMNTVFAASFDPFSFGPFKSLGLDKLFDQSTSNDNKSPQSSPQSNPQSSDSTPSQSGDSAKSGSSNEGTCKQTQPGTPHWYCHGTHHHCDEGTPGCELNGGRPS
jgi:hypothetical protein